MKGKLSYRFFILAGAGLAVFGALAFAAGFATGFAAGLAAGFGAGLAAGFAAAAGLPAAAGFAALGAGGREDDVPAAAS